MVFTPLRAKHFRPYLALLLLNLSVGQMKTKGVANFLE